MESHVLEFDSVHQSNHIKLPKKISSKKTSKCCLICCYIIFSILPICDLIYGILYFNDKDCSNSDLIKPALWLIITGTISLFTILITIINLIWENDIAVIFQFIIISLLFDVAWAIIGGVMLWRDNLQCDPKSFHDFVWATVILHIVFVFNAVFRAKN